MRYYLLALIVLLSSCSCISSILGKAPSENVDDQIRYHQEQIRKYKTKVHQEEHNAQISLSRQDMGDVKRAHQRKAKYVEKIEEHAKELKKLKAEKKSGELSLIALRSEVEDRQDVKSIDSEISSLTQLKEYYIKKAGRARERGTRLQYQGFLAEAQEKMNEANEYDDIVKKLDAKIGELQLQKDAIIRRNTTLPLSQA